jgi:hypothetical protein
MHQTIQGWIVSKLTEEDLEGKGPGLIEVVTELAWKDKSSENVLLKLPNTNQIFTITPTCSAHFIMLLHYLPTNLYYLWNLEQLHIRHPHTLTKWQIPDLATYCMLLPTIIWVMLVMPTLAIYWKYGWALPACHHKPLPVHACSKEVRRMFSSLGHKN